jgi:ABC-type nitrate/sulfonate/bicarbonate transport system ATPase subunit
MQAFQNRYSVEESQSQSPPLEALLSIRNVSFGHAQKIVIQIDHLDVHSGEVVAIVGPSGSGKTSVLATLAGMIEPVEGEILLNGRVRPATWRAQHTAFTQQSFPLFHWLTVMGNLRLACRIRGVAASGLTEILQEFSANHLADRFPHTLSGGERCRASLAQAVVAHPSLMLLDEPFTGLDNLVKQAVSESVFRFAEERKVGVILVTHDLYDACEFAHKVVVLATGDVTRIRAQIDTSRPDAVLAVRDALRAG